MKIKLVFGILALGCSLYYGIAVFGGCPPTWSSSGSFTVCPDRPDDQRDWRIVWWDGF